MSIILGMLFGWLRKVFVWLIEHPRELLIVVLVAAGGWLWLRGSHYEHRYQVTRAQLADLGSKVQRQNAAVVTLKAQTAKQAVALHAAQQRAISVKATMDSRLRQIAAQRVPHACTGAIRWAATEGPQLRWSQ